VKNVLVAFAPAAAGVLTRPRIALDVALAFVAFCLLSSATYLVNDVRDRAEDRHHPRKRHRPVAAGELAPRGALRIAGLLALAGIGVCVVVSPALAAVGACYLTLTTTYSFCWRHVVIADIVAVAGGFLLRATAGGVAADVRLSRAFLVVTSACALFMVAGKRYAELGERAGAHVKRASLRRHSRVVLRWLLAGSAVIGLVAYVRWAFSRHELGPWFELSILPFALWLARYGTMLLRGGGEAPEELILRDPALLALAGVWGVLFIAGVYVAH
jgi:decaprenyl-phosphate phosphoribosyltransferase